MSGFKGTLLRILISFGAIAWIVYAMRGEIKDAVQIMRTDVIWSWFFLSFAIYIIANVIIGIRMRFIFQSQGIFFSYGQGIYLALLGLFFNLFLPSAVGGDIAKVYYSYKHTGKKIESMSAVLQDRLMGFFVLMSIGFAALLFLSTEFSNPKVTYTIYTFVGIMFFAIFFLFSKRFAKNFKFLAVFIPTERLKTRLRELYHAIYELKNHRKIFAGALGLSLLAQTLFVISHYLLAVALSVDMSFWLFFLIIPVVAIVSMAPSVGGLGVREAGLIFFLKVYMPDERALVFSILLDMVIYGLSLLCGAVYALKGGLRPKIIHEMESIET